ncbi:MAG: SDR family oxidoreductase [Sphingobium sp.]|jgi:3-oxoacyl-[acyl-carrier protein] reductase|nr:SDR family oxidoreductase [Sphingobium sp.]MCI1272297.1 SDR family oxidoreductase [Sphingobium sp.]MCI1756655.1 SDR family oxidoreductase [Sphingobium sp.]MCI2052922.1 SDR family oxidoreductase [Sphingobium sp.]
MDLGIAGKTALVCASSRGLGRGCAEALAREGARVIINGLDPARLEQTASALRESTGAEIIAIAVDVGTEEGRAALLEAAGDVDILINNNGGPSPSDFRKLTHAQILAGLEANMLTPIALVQAVIDGMIARKFGRIVNITSMSVKMPIPMLDLSSGARIGLTGFLAGVARQVAADNVTINNLLPGAIDTDRITALDTKIAETTGRDYAEARARRERSIAARRLGTTEEFGAACAFLCSRQASYITGQSILIDGGAYPGVL